MPLDIQNEEADRLAAELARLTGESISEVVTRALAERLERERRNHAVQQVAAGLMDIGRRYAALPDRDTRSPDEILGYDESYSDARRVQL